MEENGGGGTAKTLKLLENSPILFLEILHELVRRELQELHELVATDSDMQSVTERYRFLTSFYDHYSHAKDEIIFRALDTRVKNVALSYSLVHKNERDLFDHLFELLDSDKRSEEIFKTELASRTGALCTYIKEHMAKEKEQVLPLLVEKFSSEEQGSLIWQFLCSFPVNMMKKFLPWVSSSISPHDNEDVPNWLGKIIPNEKFLQQVILTWMKGQSRSGGPDFIMPQGSKFKTMDKKRKYSTSVVEDAEAIEEHPIDDILLWHKAILGELKNILIEARKIELAGDFSCLSPICQRLQFIAEVCMYHSIAEDKVIFPAVDGRPSFSHEHAEERTRFNELLRLIEGIQKSVHPTSASKFFKKICSEAEGIFQRANQHFQVEEIQVLPLAKKHFGAEIQRCIMYQSMCEMPLTLIERALPWVVNSGSEDDGKRFFQTLTLAAPVCDNALLTLFSGWASKGRSNDHVPGLGVNSIRLGLSAISTPSLNSRIFSWKSGNNSLTVDGNVHPIDTIFKFHKSILEDLKCLDDLSKNLSDHCDESFRHQFIGRFRLMWALYRAHSKAEDDVVFPALESKEALKNVSHSYTLDHKHEEKLFEEISKELSQLDVLHEDLKRQHNIEHVEGNFDDFLSNFIKLARNLQGMCKSLRFSLNSHIFREEQELWPLFGEHFSVEEQDNIVGLIMGRTSAEVLKFMLQSVTLSLNPDEQNMMMSTIRQATKETKFSEWLDEWGRTPEVPAQLETVGTSHSTRGVISHESSKQCWQDTFRLYQAELKAEIIKVYADPTNGNSKKAHLLQNLMTSPLIYPQKKTQALEDEILPNEGEAGQSPCFHDPQEQIFGCKHYKRNCKIRASCCGKLVTCRFCHDEEVKGHKINRKNTVEMMCMRCLKIQPIGPVCGTPSCNGFSMAKYYCSVCKFFYDDEKNIYHCPFCNVCRVGKDLGIGFFHCMKCNWCISIKAANHTCSGDSSKDICAICLDIMHISLTPVRKLPHCTHLMHEECYQEYIRTNYVCPTCKKSACDTTAYIAHMDSYMATEQVPEEYHGHTQEVLCNDCGWRGPVRWHMAYHKCGGCGSYNTTRVV